MLARIAVCVVHNVYNTEDCGHVEVSAPDSICLILHSIINCKFWLRSKLVNSHNFTIKRIKC